TLDWWATSDRRRAARARLAAAAAVAPDDVIMGPDAARRAGLASTVVFPVGNLAPEGAVIKATALDPSVVGADQVYRHLGAARVRGPHWTRGTARRPDRPSARRRPDRDRDRPRHAYGFGQPRGSGRTAARRGRVHRAARATAGPPRARAPPRPAG